MLWLKLIWILLVIKVFLICFGKKHGFAFYLSVEAVNKASDLHRLFLFRRKTLNGVVREFNVNWLFCTDGWWCLNVSLLKQWLSYHSLHEPGSHRSQILSSCLSQLLAWKGGGGRGKMVGVGGAAQCAWCSSSSARADCQTRLGSQQVYTDTAAVPPGLWPFRHKLALAASLK